MKLIMTDSEIREAIVAKAAIDFNTVASNVSVVFTTMKKGNKMEAEIELLARVVDGPKVVKD